MIRIIKERLHRDAYALNPVAVNKIMASFTPAFLFGGLICAGMPLGTESPATSLKAKQLALDEEGFRGKEEFPPEQFVFYDSGEGEQ